MLKLSASRPSLRARMDGLTPRRALDQSKALVRWGVTQAIPRTVFRTAARRGDLQGRLIGTALQGHTFDLVPLFEELYAAGPVHKGGFSYITGRHAVVHEVLSGNDFRTGIPSAVNPVMQRLVDWSANDVFTPVTPPSLLVSEPPDHTRYRKLVTRVFTVRAVEQLRARTEEIAGELLDRLAGQARGPVDLVAAYCGLLPVTVISEILGVLPEDRELVLELGAGAAASLDLGLGWRQFRSVEASLGQFQEWLRGHMAHVRANPGENLLSQLVRATEDGVGLTEAELGATAGLVLAAGFETTVNLLGNGIALLAEHRDQLDLVRSEPERWANAVEEVLRIDPPVLLTGRVVARETELEGTRLPEGSVVTVVLAAANRDPEVFADPHAFDVTRANARDHMSFSSGRHYCLGAALARMEGEVGLRMLFERFPDLRLAPGAVRRSTRILRGYESLPALLS